MFELEIILCTMASTIIKCVYSNGKKATQRFIILPFRSMAIVVKIGEVCHTVSGWYLIN